MIDEHDTIDRGSSSRQQDGVIPARIRPATVPKAKPPRPLVSSHFEVKCTPEVLAITGRYSHGLHLIACPWR
jgi:hypothetical protein